MKKSTFLLTIAIATVFFILMYKIEDKYEELKSELVLTDGKLETHMETDEFSRVIQVTNKLTPHDIQYSGSELCEDYKVYYIDKPHAHEKKIYTVYTAVTDRSSKQYKLFNSDKRYTDISGVCLIKDKNDVYRYTIALGPYWANGEIGRYVDIYMENGSVLPCITCDVKQWVHTMDGKGKYGINANDLIEFYVDPTRLNYVDSYNNTPLYFSSGDVSTAKEEFSGAVEKIVVWDIYQEGFEP